MDRIVLYSEGVEPERLTHDISDIEIVTVYSQRRLIECLVDDPSLIAAVVHIASVDPQWTRFLDSISQSFPRLPVLLLRPSPGAGCPDEYPCLNPDAPNANIGAAVQHLIGERGQSERRKHHRFAWPLTATLVGGDGVIHRISEISAGGAYLEPMATVFETGQAHQLEIHFQNFKMKASCVILDPRHTSSHKSSGFGVRFVDLSAEAASFIDRIVNDALVEVLLDPGAAPSIPSLEDDDLLSIGSEFSLA